MNETRIQQTGTPEVVEASDGRLILSVPIQIKRRSGRKLGFLDEQLSARVSQVLSGASLACSNRSANAC